MSDTKSIFDWVQNNASKIQRGISKGIQKTKQAKKTINEKIESHPRAKAARDLATEFIKAQAERLSEVRIRGTRVAEFPNAAQRLTERKI